MYAKKKKIHPKRPFFIKTQKNDTKPISQCFRFISSTRIRSMKRIWVAKNQPKLWKISTQKITRYHIFQKYLTFIDGHNYLINNKRNHILENNFFFYSKKVCLFLILTHPCWNTQIETCTTTYLLKSPVPVISEYTLLEPSQYETNAIF